MEKDTDLLKRYQCLSPRKLPEKGKEFEYYEGRGRERRT